MNRFRCLAASTFIAGALVGLACSRQTAPPPEAKDPAVYAPFIKTLVNEFVADNRDNHAEAPKQAAVLLETLEVYKLKPVGDHEAIYAELTERCKELTTAKGASVSKKLDEMSALVKKLP